MPVSSNPNARAPFWLRCDEETPMKERPVFLVKFMTTAEVEQYGRVLWEAVTIGVTGWRNVNDADGKPIPFDAEHVIPVLTEPELFELACNYPSAVRLAPEDYHFFASPSGSAAGGSAGSAAPAAA
jgi:hypothetical protein